jgi:hypothetical protein
MHKKTVLIRLKQQILYNIVQLLLISIAKILFLIPQFFSISVIQLFSKKHIYVPVNLCLRFLKKYIFYCYLCLMTKPEYTEHQAVTKVAKKEILLATKKETPVASPSSQVH